MDQSPLFPDDRPVLPPAIPRWLRMTVTLTAEGVPAHVDIEALGALGELLMNRGYWPLPGEAGSKDPLRMLLRVGWELVHPD